jgi:hypothetical protein
MTWRLRGNYSSHGERGRFLKENACVNTAAGSQSEPGAKFTDALAALLGASLGAARNRPLGSKTKPAGVRQKPPAQVALHIDQFSTTLGISKLSPTLG